MIHAWTYRDAPSHGLYWYTTDDGPLVYLDIDGMSPHFRKVKDGSKDCFQDPQGYDWRGKQLAREHWPQWLLDMDDCYVDEGL